MILLKMNITYQYKKCPASTKAHKKIAKYKAKKKVNKMSDYEESLSNECKRRNFDGLVCGHIHKAEITTINGVSYHNCGDWVESCTALVETNAGEFKIIDWGMIERADMKLISNG